MIKKYNLYKESLLNKMVGPSDEEILNLYKDDPNALLSVGLYYNNNDIIFNAIKQGVDVLKRNKLLGTVPLRYIISRKEFELIDLLIENDADFSPDNYRALVFLLIECPIECVEKILNYIEKKYGKKPLKSLKDDDIIYNMIQYYISGYMTPDYFMQILPIYKKYGLYFNISYKTFKKVISSGNNDILKTLIKYTIGDINKIKEIPINFEVGVKHENMISIIKTIMNIK